MVTVGPYKLGQTVGMGTFAKVRVATHSITDQKVAIKVINKRKMEQMNMHEKLRREINILQFLKHPHVMRFYELIDTPSDIFMVTEYVPGGELFDHIVHKLRLPEDEARRLFQQILSGVEYCHNCMVTHRDLKPENLLLDGNLHIKIGDFGLSNTMKDGEFLKTSCGSPNYASPEVVSGKAYVGPEVDVWSCGVVLYALLCGSLPFDDENVPNLFRKIKHGNFTLPGHLSSEAKDLIVQMLVVDPTRRITFAQIRKHSWFMKDLPEYLDGELRQTLRKTQLDEEIVQELQDLGLKIDDKDRLKPEELVAYQLLADRQSKQSSFTNLVRPDQRRKDAPGMFSDEEMQLVSRKHDQDSSGPLYKLTPAGERGVIISQAQTAALECPWQLGIEVSMEAPQLVTEVLNVLHSLNYEWCNVTPWRIRAQPMQRPESGSQLKIMLTIQVYKTAANRYLVDVLLSQGPSLLALNAALQLLRHIATNPTVAPNVLEKPAQTAPIGSRRSLR